MNRAKKIHCPTNVREIQQKTRNSSSQVIIIIIYKIRERKKDFIVCLLVIHCPLARQQTMW